MSDHREQEALSAYLSFLEKKGVDNQALQQRRDFLNPLTDALTGVELDGKVYRKAVEVTIEPIDKALWPFSLSVAREYYPFWIQDIKAIAAMNEGQIFDVKPVNWQPQDCNLKTIWGYLDKEKFSLVENWALKAYTLALRQDGAAQDIVDTRLKLVKLLLVRLRDAPEQSSKIYRVGVDSTLGLFLLQDTRRLFLAVAREFYYFWIGDPDAPSYLGGKTPPGHF